MRAMCVWLLALALAPACAAAKTKNQSEKEGDDSVAGRQVQHLWQS